MEEHLYPQTASRKYGIWFGKPASGIGNQIHLEHFAIPGETVLGAGSHTPPHAGVAVMRGSARGRGEMQPDSDADYDEPIDGDLATIEPLVALPSLPDHVVPVREVAGTKVEQVMVGSCTNGSYTDLQAVAKVMKGRRVHPEVYFFIHPSSRADLELLAREGYVTDLLAAGVNVAEPTCGACIGFGHVPAPGTKSLRAINRNFKGRSGLSDDQVYLASPETAAATAIKGVITDPRDLGMELSITAPAAILPDAVPQENPNLIPPASEAEAAGITVLHGENIRPSPVKPPLEETLHGTVLIKVGDDISTDHIMPAGAEIVAYRSNIARLAEYVFHRMDPEFSARAKARGGGFIVGGENYGQGSSREHAALAPMYLGVRAVLAKSFSRIHHANLINWGIVPLLFTDPADYDGIDRDDELEIPKIRDGILQGAHVFTVRNQTKGRQFTARVEITPRDRGYLLAGGKLAHVKQHPVRCASTRPLQQRPISISNSG